MKNIISERLQEYKKLPKWYYHLSFDHLEKSQLFNNEQQFADGMNSVAIGQFHYNINIITFNLMANHCHFLVHSLGSDIVSLFFYLKKRFNDRLNQDGDSLLPKDYFFKLVKVEDKPQLESVIIYIARNPFKALKDTMPSGYIWGTNYLIFSKITKLIDKVPLKNLGARAQRNMFHSRFTFPSDYLFNRPMGFILPESYVKTNKANEVLGTSWNYCSKLIKNMDAMIMIAEGISEEFLITDDELGMIINDCLHSQYGVKKVFELSNDDRCRLAVLLRKKYKIEPKRIGRTLHIDKDVITKLFSLRQNASSS